MRYTLPFLALTVLPVSAAAVLPPMPALSQQMQTAAPVTPDPEAAGLIAEYNRQTADPGLSETARTALAAELDRQLQALLTAAANAPQKTREIIAAMKAARIGLPLTEEVRAVLETAGRTATEIRKRQDETAIAEIVDRHAGDQEAIAERVSDYIAGSDDPVRTTGVAARMAVTPQYESVKPALGAGIGRAIAMLGIAQPELASQMATAAQEVDDPALQNAIAGGEQEITGTPATGSTDSDTPEEDPTPEKPASAS